MTKQLEFDFWDRPLDGDKLYTKPAVEYFKRAFEYEPVRAEVEKREEAFNTKPVFKVGDKVSCKDGGVGVVASIVSENVSVFKSKTYVSRIHNSELTPVSDEPAPTKNEPILSTDSAERKATPIWSGWIQYFPLAHAAAARHSFRMNQKHNPGQPMHWAREKSKDHEDCAQRHLVDVNHFNEETQEYEEACSLFWRAGAILQLLEEKRLWKTK